MSEIASLVISIDSSDADRAAKSLRELAQYGKFTENSLKQTGDSGRNLRKVSSEANEAARSLGLLESAAKGALAALSIREIVGAVDSYTQLTAQLKLATNSTHEYARAYQMVRDIARSTQADLASTAVLYARIATATRELGVSQQTIADVTEAINLSLRVSGASASEASSAILQLSQAFNSGVLRGEEFNSVIESAPRLIQALADGMGVSVGQMRSLAEEGRITADVMANILPQALGKLRDEAQHVQTIGGAFQNLKSSVLELIGTQAEASGFSRTVSTGLNLIADNLNTVLTLAGALAAARIAGSIAGIAKEIISLGSTAAAARQALSLLGGGFGALVGVLATGAAVWMSYRESINATRKALTDLEEPIDKAIEKFKKLSGIEQQVALKGLSEAVKEAEADLNEALENLSKAPLKLRNSPAFAEFKREIDGLAKQARDGSMSVEELNARVSEVVRTFLEATPGARSASKAIEQAGVAVINMGRRYGDLKERLGEVEREARGAASAIDAVALSSAKAALGLQTKEWDAFIQKAEAAATAVGMSAQQLGEFQARVMGASEEQAKLAGILFGMADAAKKLEKATAEKDTKAQAGAKALLTALAQQEVQLRTNMKYAQEYARYLAAGFSVAEAGDLASSAALASFGEIEKDVTERLNALFRNIANNTELSKSFENAGKQLKQWLAEQNIATESAKKLADAYLQGGSAVAELARQQKIEEQVLRSGEAARKAVTEAVTAHQRALDRLDIAKQIDDLRRQAQAGTQYVAVLAAQSKGYTAGRAALAAYNREQALAELLVGKIAAEVADLRDVYGQLWDRLESTNIQREAMEELNGLVESTATRQERYNRELEKLLALAPYAQTEEQARALQRAIEDLNRENSVWFEFTQDAIERINEAFADMWRDAFDGSRSAFDGMKRAFRQMLAEMAHAAITRPIVISLGNAIMGTNTPGGIGDVWGGGNRVLGTAQNLYSGYNAVSGGLSNTLGNAAQWLGQKVGSEALTSFGLGLSGTTAATGIASIGAGLGASLGTSIGTSAAAMTTTSFSAALSGGALVPGLGVGAAGGGVGAGIGAAGAAGGAAAGGAASAGAAFGAALPWIGGALAIGSLLGGGLFDREPTTRREQRTQVEYSGGALGITSRDDRVQAGTDAAVAQMTAAAIESANSLFRQIGIDAAIDSFHAILASSYQGDRDGVASGGRLRIGDRLVDIGIPDDENPTIKGFGGWSSAETLPRLATDIQLTVLEAFQAASDQLPNVLASMLEGIDIRSLGEQEAQALAERFTALTQGAAAFLSTLEQTPFAKLRDLSFDAAAGMVQFAGSVDNLLSAQQTYYDRYYSEQEKFEHSVNQLSQALSGVGVVMPELTGSTDDMLASYRRLVESLDLTTEAGQQAYVTLMQNAGAFADVAQYAGQAASAVEGAARSLADIARERESLERQLLQLQGDTAELRRRELEALDESNHALQRYIWALQDQRSAWDAAVAAGESAFSALSRSIAAEKTRLQRESESIASALRNSISAASTTVNELTSLTGRLTSTVQRMIGQGLDESRNRAWAQERIDRALSVAKLTGVMPQGEDFEQALQIVAQPSEGLFSSFEDYQADFLRTAHTVSELNELAEGQLSTEKRALKALEDQLSHSQQWYQAEMERLDAMLEQERQALDIAMGTYEAVLTIPEAIAGVRDAIANLQMTPTPPSPGSGPGASWDDLYLSAKLAELQNKGAVSHGIDWQSGTINDLAAVFASEGLTPRLHYELYGKDEGIDEWMKRLPGFAVGTNYVPYDMVARIHEGERIIPATDNRKLMQMLARGVDRDNTNRLLQQEIRELRLMMERKLDGVERNTGEVARTNRQMVEQRQIVQVEGPVATVLVEDRTA